MSEKYEKCPNCDEKLTGMFSGSVVEDEVIREINEKIKNKQEELKDSGEDLVEKEAFCTGCIDNVKEIVYPKKYTYGELAMAFFGIAEDAAKKNPSLCGL